MASLTPEETAVEVGSETVSDSIEVIQAVIDGFADAAGDHQFIHVDPAAAAKTPFGGTIAHGFLTPSLMPLLASEVPDAPQLDSARMGVNHGGNKVRFLAPVPSGSRVRGRFKLLAFEQKRRGRYQQTTKFTVEIEGQEKPALIAKWIGQAFI